MRMFKNIAIFVHGKLSVDGLKRGAGRGCEATLVPCKIG